MGVRFDQVNLCGGEGTWGDKNAGHLMNVGAILFIDKCSLLLLFKSRGGDRSEILRALNTGKWQENN